ncbi:MAG TPA: thiolase family protein [Acidimicrobiia bacterium]|nr:thiolase family protein [Acidimicrobiia bacterium]
MKKGLDGDACIVGIAERRAERKFTGTPTLTLEQWAALAADALADAGIPSSDVDGIVCAGDVAEASLFVPATIAEYCGWSVNFAEKMDLGGATAVGMVWRAAAAVELGLCEVVVCATVGQPRPARPDRSGQPPGINPRVVYGASSMEWGSPQAEFDVPYGNVAQNCGYAMYAQRYHELYGWDERGRAKIASDQRISACVNPDAVFHGQPITVDDVLASRVIAAPLHLLEIVMPCSGGAAFVVTTAARARDVAHRPVTIAGFGERLTHKTPTYAAEMPRTPVRDAAARAFGMAGVAPGDVDMVQLYDCYTITALLTIEDSGFCGAGEGMAFVTEHDLSYRGDFPCNTHGGQLGMGQTGLSGGTSHVMEAVRQVQGRAGERQLARHDVAYVTGTGGVMSEQAAVVLTGA